MSAVAGLLKQLMFCFAAPRASAAAAAAAAAATEVLLLM